MILKTRIAQRAFNTPLLMHPGKAVAALSAVGGRIVEGGLQFPDGIAPVDHVAFENGRPSAGTVGDGLGRAYDRSGRYPFDMLNNVAIIPIEGTLVHKGSFVGMSSGETSYEGIQAQVLRAMRSDQVRGVAFEVDSYGGEVSGAFETADMIAALSKLKPTLAILTDHAYSAGYLMAAAARQVIVPETGGAGSIGVVMMHVDYSQALAEKGLKVTFIYSGDHKVEGNGFEPLPDDVKAKWQKELDTSRDLFADAVGRFRGSRLTAKAALATEAAVYRGSDAVSVGLADAVGHGSDAFNAFIRAVNNHRP
jgi:signal peptide peptidase SppA